MIDVRLSRLIAPAFFAPWRAAREGRCDELWLHGGRGSGKSSFVSLFIICGLMDEPEANAIVYRKVADTLRESVYAQFKWAIDLLEVSDWFRLKLSPLEIEYIPTGQRILFRGSDKPEKSKGVKLAKGYFKYLWFEELTEFSGMADIRIIKASILRGTQEKTCTFYTYNPPMSAANWVNKEILKTKTRRRLHHSDYRDIPAAWLGDAFLREAEALKEHNPREYRHMYLGEVTGTGAQVFENVKLQRLRPSAWQGLRTYKRFGFRLCVRSGRVRALCLRRAAAHPLHRGRVRGPAVAGRCAGQGGEDARRG